MHEAHIVEAIVKQVLEKAGAAGAKKVTLVTLAMGEQCGFDEGCVRLYFENFSEGTAAAGAKLVFKPVPQKLTCRKCGNDFERKGSDLNCPLCCSMGFLNRTGKEFYVENIEIES
ncbi:MAG: hydrogenase maturation nickel metallochaperone HypA [Candidatus Omnitrophota bacterium]|jgi:hydrogenase nickel insertion protein HypA